MKCLCCGRDIPEKATEKEKLNLWHLSCAKRFFGVNDIPVLDISEETLKALAIESTNKGYTVPGVQKKLSLHLTHDEKQLRLTLLNYPTGYILKPQTEEFKNLPEAEYLVMQMAKATGIKVVPFALIKLKDNLAYITRRVDRGDVMRPSMLAMEDFCQLDERLTEDKYKGSYERCAKIIDRYSSRKNFDLSELYLRLVFSFVIGNSDMHLKNFSLRETSESSGEYALSEAYDLLPVNVILPEDKEQFALTMNGKKRNLKRGDFLKFATAIGLEKNIAEKLILNVVKKKNKYLELCDEALITDSAKQTLKELIAERIDALINIPPTTIYL